MEMEHMHAYVHRAGPTGALTEREGANHLAQRNWRVSASLALETDHGANCYVVPQLAYGVWALLGRKVIYFWHECLAAVPSGKITFTVVAVSHNQCTYPFGCTGLTSVVTRQGIHSVWWPRTKKLKSVFTMLTYCYYS